MKSLTLLAIEIYQKLGKEYPNLTERREATKQYILTEITQWSIKKLNQGNVIIFKPREFKGTNDSSPFEVRLVYDSNDNFWELKFGNLNAPTPEDQFKWDNNDSNRLPKALFLQKIMNDEIIPFMKNTESEGIKFEPYDGDGMEDDRLSYFQNMFRKLNSNEFEFNKGYSDEDDTWYITKKIN
jgi:hypothetical protein